MEPIRLRFQGGLSRFKVEDPSRPYSLTNARVEPRGVIVALKDGVLLFHTWNAPDWTVFTESLVNNRPPWWKFRDNGNTNIEVHYVAEGTPPNRRVPWWKFRDNGETNIEVHYVGEGSPPAADPIFNIEEGETIDVEVA